MYLKLAYRLFVVILIVVACSCTSVGSVAHAETLSAMGAATDQSVDSTNPAPDSTVNATVDALAAQAAVAGIGVRIVNGVKVFHTRDGRDLEMVKVCDGSDGVRYYGEVMTLKSALAWELHPHMGIELPGDLKLPADSSQRALTAGSVPNTIAPVPYSQLDSQWSGLPLGWGRIDRPTIGAEGCYVTCAAMEAATYGLGLNPASLNTWLNNNGGFTYCASENAYNDLVFEKMSLLPSIGGIWQSWQNYMGIPMVYLCAQSFIVGSSSVKPSLPIVKMHKTGVPVHYSAWYGSNGTQDPEKNLIVQPTLTPYSNDSLKCTFVCGAGNKNYSPVTDPDLMRVAWKK